jgi:hypothetical protein
MTDGETRVALRTAFLVLKAQSIAISTLRADVGALLHALVEINAGYKSVVEFHHQKHIQELRNQVHEDLERLQEMIDKLEEAAGASGGA